MGSEVWLGLEVGSGFDLLIVVGKVRDGVKSRLHSRGYT